MSEESQVTDQEFMDDVRERKECICNEGIHDGNKIDCACKCYEENEDGR